jgi:hypothetical protein
MKKQEKRYPLKEKPRHHAGQSLDEQLTNIKIIDYLSIILVASILIQLLFDWWNWYSRVINNPTPQAIFAGIIVIGVGYFNYILRKKAKSIELGSAGEKIAAQDLDNLKQLGCSIYHDIVIKDKKYTFNIDHIVVSNRGIFAIETKTFSKPLKGLPKAHYDGKKIVRSGRGSISCKMVEESNFCKHG